MSNVPGTHSIFCCYMIQAWDWSRTGIYYPFTLLHPKYSFKWYFILLPWCFSVKPEFIKSPFDKTVIMGNPVTMECEVRGYPTPVIKWLYNVSFYSFDIVSLQLSVMKIPHSFLLWGYSLVIYRTINFSLF